jgi:hypothetical protein
MSKVIKWVKSQCPECGCEYEHPEDYKPATCSKFDCIHRHLHPNIYNKRTVSCLVMEDRK